MLNHGYPLQQAPSLSPVGRTASYPAPRQGLSARLAQILILSATLVGIFMLTSISTLFLGDGNNNSAPAIISENQSDDQEEVEVDTPEVEVDTPVAEPANSLNEQEKFVGDGSSTVFELSQTPKSDHATEFEVLVDGSQAEFSLEGQIITFNSPPSDGADIIISYVRAEQADSNIADTPPEVDIDAPEPIVLLPITIEPSLAPIHAHPRPPPEPDPIIEPDPIVEPDPIIEPDPIVEPPDNIDQQYPLISQEIKDLANELQLTNKAKKTLYDHNPRIFEDPDDAGYACGHGDANTVIYGCWSIQAGEKSIQLIRSPSMQTTLAHELLHAIYYNARSRGETEELHALLDQVKQQYPSEIAEILKFYEEHFDTDANDKFLEYSEMHSFIGSQFHDLPEALEEHYSRHFKNRQRILTFYDIWHTSLETKKEENNQIQAVYNKQVEQWEECVQTALLSRQECLFYRPENQAYQDYNACLLSYQTLMSECLELKPPIREYVADAG